MKLRLVCPHALGIFCSCRQLNQYIFLGPKPVAKSVRCPLFKNRCGLSLKSMMKYDLPQTRVIKCIFLNKRTFFHKCILSSGVYSSLLSSCAHISTTACMLLVLHTDHTLVHYLMIDQLSVTADCCQQKLSGLGTMADNRRRVVSRTVAWSAICSLQVSNISRILSFSRCCDAGITPHLFCGSTRWRSRTACTDKH